MKERKERKRFDKYSEKLIPTLITITRQRGNLNQVFVIDGHKGVNTGELYYKAKDIDAIDQFLESGEAPFDSFVFYKLGLVVDFETTQYTSRPMITITHPPVDLIAPDVFVAKTNSVFVLQPTEATR